MSAERMNPPNLSASTISRMPSRALAALVLMLAASLLPVLRSGTEIALPPPVAAGRGAAVWAEPDWGRMPLYFIANQGQMDERVAFYVEGRDKTLYFTAEGVTFALTSAGKGEAAGRWVVKLDFPGANAVPPVGAEQTGTVTSYFRGAPDEWHTGLPTYARIVYRDLWPGIDLAYSGTVGRLKYEFVVRPGADPGRIRLAYRGANVRLSPAGALEVSTPAGGFQDDVPVAYQEVDGVRVPVAVTYALEGEATYGFRVGAYDPTLPLVIDPAMLVYCGYIGGSNEDTAEDIAVDAAGYAYVTGGTRSSQAAFPVAVGPDPTHNGDWDAFVAKVKADGTGLVYAGYIGGSGLDGGWGIAVDAVGNAYVTGRTASSQATFPVIGGPDLAYGGGNDAFIAKVRADGTGLIYAGYIGGSDEDWGKDIAVDAAGNAYVVGYTFSDAAEGFPVKTGPDITYNDEGDAFIARVKADGSGFVYAGYIGGEAFDSGNAIALDAAGNATIAGATASSEATFPVTVGPGLTHNGGSDAFVAKVKADGSGLVYAGYIGGSEDDEANGVAVDAAGHAWVAGSTRSAEDTFPVAVGPDLTHNGGWDAFVAKVKADGSGLLAAGYIGGNSEDRAEGIALDATGYACITGKTHSSQATFPVSVGPDLTHNGLADAFVAKIKADGSGLAYCGYIGGSSDDEGLGIAVSPAGDAYVAGQTRSSQATFPVIVGPDLTYNGGSSIYGDAFVAKVQSASPFPEYPIPTADGAPYGIAVDTSGHIWFTELGGNKIGKLTLADGDVVTVTEYAIPTADSSPAGIIAGPDGTMWFTEYDGNKIGRITSSDVITEYALPHPNSAPIAITVGPDGNLWFCEDTGNRIGKMSPAGELLAEYNVPTANSAPNAIVAGPDGALWFTEYDGKKIGRITTDGAITEYTVSAKPFGIAPGPDGNLWFTETNANRVGRITPAGEVTEFNLPGDANGPLGIAAGPFGSLWVVANFSNKILRVLPSGAVLREYAIPMANSGAIMIAADDRGRLWFTEMDADQIGRLTPQEMVYLPLVLRNR